MIGLRDGGARAQRAVIGHLAVVCQIEDSGEAGRRRPKSTNNSKHTTQWASAEEGLDAIILKRSGFGEQQTHQGLGNNKYITKQAGGRGRRVRAPRGDIS